MIFKPTRLPEVVLIEPKVFGDARGFFMETWEARKFADGGINASFRAGQSQPLQPRSATWPALSAATHTGQSWSASPKVKSSTLRWMCAKSSPTYGQWVGEYLSGDNHRMLWIPPGFAHGFVVLSERVDFLYKVTDFYDPSQ